MFYVKYLTFVRDRACSSVFNIKVRKKSNVCADMAASICKARILRFRCMLLRREDKAQAIRNTSFPSTVISYRKKNKAIVRELNE